MVNRQRGPPEPIVFYRYALKKWFRLSQYRWVSKEGMAAGESDRERFRKVVSYERSLYNTNKWVSNVLERHHFLMKSSKRDNISCCDAIETPWLMDAHWPCHMSSISAEWEANLRGVRGEIWCPNWWFQTPPWHSRCHSLPNSLFGSFFIDFGVTFHRFHWFWVWKSIYAVLQYDFEEILIEISCFFKFTRPPPGFP